LRQLPAIPRLGPFRPAGSVHAGGCRTTPAITEVTIDAAGGTFTMHYATVTVTAARASP